MDIDPVTEFDRFQEALGALETAGDWRAVERLLRSGLRLVALAPETHVQGRPKAAFECTLWERLGAVYRDRLDDPASAKTVFDLLRSRGWEVDRGAGLDVILPALLAEEGPPPTVGALVRALGVGLGPEHLARGSQGRVVLPPGRPPLPTADVTSLQATYVWDRMHEAPVSTVEDLLGRSVVGLSVGLAHPIDALGAGLASRLGASRVVGASLVWSAWIATSSPDGASTLSFHRTLPDWALEAPDPSVRERALVDLGAALRAATDGASLEAAAAAIPTGAGLLVTARPAPGQRPRLGLTFAPSMKALELARVFGWSGVVARTLAFHRDAWEVWIAADAATGAPPYDRPSVGVWTATPHLEGHPRGRALDAPGQGPLGGALEIGPDELVRAIDFA